MSGVPAGPAESNGSDPADSNGPRSAASRDPLLSARDRHGRTPRSWLESSVPGEPVIRLRLPPGGNGELVDLAATPTSPESLPLPSRSVAGATLEMCLPSVLELDGLFAELRRVLRPAGTVAALVPSFPSRLGMWRTLHRCMGGRPSFRNESARANLHWLFAAADFAVLTDQRRTFRLPIPDGAAAGHAVESLLLGGAWPPDLTPAQLESARQTLSRCAAPGRSLSVPLRLLVARR